MNEDDFAALVQCRIRQAGGALRPNLMLDGAGEGVHHLAAG